MVTTTDNTDIHMQDKHDSEPVSRSPSRSVDGIPQPKDHDDEIDLMELFRTYVIPYWKKYLLAAFLGAVLFTAASYLFTPKYETQTKAQIQLGSASDSLKSKLGGLAMLAGMNMNAGDSQFMFNVNYIQSREIADAFIAKYDLRHKLFYDSYDDDGSYEHPSSMNNLYKKLLGAGYQDVHDDDIYQTPGPSKEELYKKFNKVFSIDVDQKEMSVTVTVKWKDPLKVKQWANDYIRLVNDLLKDKAIKENTLRINYLEARTRSAAGHLLPDRR
jgi:uncharacterized protein involved in exopolysaccharide biosynthesis